VRGTVEGDADEPHYSSANATQLMTQTTLEQSAGAGCEAEPIVRTLAVFRARDWQHRTGTDPVWRVQIRGWSRLVRAESAMHALARTMRHIGAT